MLNKMGRYLGNVKMENPRKPKTPKKCYLCQSLGATTQGHVIPKNMFGSPPPANLITAPACKNCNSSFSKNEEFFRVYVLAQSFKHPVAKKLWTEKVRASFNQSPKFRRMLASNVFHLSNYTPAGVYLGDIPVLYAEKDRINSVLLKVVRGLFYHIKRVYFEGQIIYVTHSIYHPHQWGILKDLPGEEFGEAVFKYKYVMNDIEPHHSWWQFVFYDRVIFTIATAPMKQLN